LKVLEFNNIVLKDLETLRRQLSVPGRLLVFAVDDLGFGEYVNYNNMSFGEPVLFQQSVENCCSVPTGP